MIDFVEKANLRNNRKNIPAPRLVGEGIYCTISPDKDAVLICTDISYRDGVTRKIKVPFYENGTFINWEKVESSIVPKLWEIAKVRGYAFSEKEKSSVELYTQYSYWWMRAIWERNLLKKISVPNFDKDPFLDKDGILTASQRNLRIKVRVTEIYSVADLEKVTNHKSVKSIKNEYIREYIVKCTLVEILKRKAKSMKSKMLKKGVEIPEI